jgi:hypothetical protein
MMNRISWTALVVVAFFLTVTVDSFAQGQSRTTHQQIRKQQNRWKKAIRKEGPILDTLEKLDRSIQREEIELENLRKRQKAVELRASALEPIQQLSGYHYGSSLGYYQSTKDASTDFFFDYVPKGIYIFEYPLRVTYAGNFSNGFTTVQCLYAPEFAAHSKGQRIIATP